MSFCPGGLIVDMDGVLYRGDSPLPGLREFFALAGTRPFVLVTNNSLLTAADCQAKLAAMGVRVPAAAILTVSEATGRYLAARFPRGGRAQVLGSAALRDAVTGAGLTLVPSGADVVVAGLDTGLSYRSLAAAVRSIGAGAAFVATSLDPVLLTADGIAPGAGAIVAAIRACVVADPLCVGKPSPEMFRLAAGLLALPMSEILVAGDNAASDIAGGAAAGARTALLLSGVSGPCEGRRARPDLLLSGLPELTEYLAMAWQRSPA